ncbi:MAG: isoprenylcysteine carboxylmethyltransferase family protein [Proteobacteria bacterium]|nr:isoprenylcysteine carboxylmethyltransferase family protein [Pseudomonadota bacterium]
MWPEQAIYIPWDIWIVTWIVAALWVNRTLKRPGGGREWPYRIVEIAGIVCLVGLIPPFYSQGSDAFYSHVAASNPLAQRYWALPPAAGWAMVALASLGFVFCWWARLHLGRLWSGRITRKEGHRVVDTGPYAIVRHPIYTGIYLAAAATMAEKGSGFAMLGFVLVVTGYWMKARLEERFLRAELGADAYDAYARKTAMLVPFVRL